MITYPQENPTMTFNTLCPAINLINNRTPKLIGFAIYDISSIGLNNKANENFVSAGKNNKNIFALCFSNVITFIPKNKENDKVKVIIK
jgi:hypothetical protein